MVTATTAGGPLSTSSTSSQADSSTSSAQTPTAPRPIPNAKNNGPTSTDTDWLARGNSLTSHGSASTRSRSSSLPSKKPPPSAAKQPSLPSIQAEVQTVIEDEPKVPLSRTQTMPEPHMNPFDSSAQPPPGWKDFQMSKRRNSTNTTSSTTSSNPLKKNWLQSFSSKFGHSSSPSPSPEPTAPVAESTEHHNGAAPVTATNNTTKNPTSSTQPIGSASSPSSSSTLSNINPPRASSPKTTNETIPALPPQTPPKHHQHNHLLHHNHHQQQQSQTQTQTPAPSLPQNSTSPQQRSLMDRLRRFSKSSPSPHGSSVSLDVPLEEAKLRPRVVLNKNWHRKQCKLPEVVGALPKRVCFDKKVLEGDPPQQIPSRHPKPGNVTILSNGDVVMSCQSLNAQQKEQQQQQNHHQNHYSQPTTASVPYFLPKNYSATAALASQTAYDAAQRIANSLKSGTGSSFRSKFLPSSSDSGDSRGDNEDEDAEAEAEALGVGPGQAKDLKIDTPMNNNNNESEKKKARSGIEDGAEEGDTEPDSPGSSDIDNGAVNPEHGMKNTEVHASLEEIYTRCCHLREILPIPATLKQIKGREAPLDMIRMMNPRPTLIEILSFSDFLGVVPIHMVILDNVNLSNEMILIVLNALVKSTTLLKLTLRNVVLEEQGWKALCAFLCENSSLVKLDLSIQADSKRSKQVLKPGTNRSHVDWQLFGKALVVRGGIDELLLNGCMIPADQLEYLMKEALPLRTIRLGLALNGLQCEDLHNIKEWIQSPGCYCQGLDLGGNNLTGCWDTVMSILSHHNLTQLSLNSTGLDDIERANALFAKLVENSQLRYLDLSANAALFPGFTTALCQWLPQFSDLKRLHLDSNNLSSEDIVVLSEAFAKCSSMVHISVLDNRRIDGTACAALTTAVDLSSTICRVEIDSDLVAEVIQKRLDHFCLTNMEAIVAGKLKDQETAEEILRQDRGDLVEVGSELANAVSDILKARKHDDHMQCQKVAETMVKRTLAVRQWINEALQELFKQKNEEGLTTKNKEKLIKLVFLDGNLEKILETYETSFGVDDKQQKLQEQDAGDQQSKQEQPQESSGSQKLMYPHASAQLTGILPNSAGTATNSSPSSGGTGACDGAGTLQQHPDLQVESIADDDDGDSQSTDGSISRRSSSTSLHAKAQEQEEGQFHRLGTFMSQHPKVSDSQIGSSASGEQVRKVMLSTTSTSKGSPQTVASLVEKIKQSHGPELSKILSTLDHHNKPDSASSSSQESSVTTAVQNGATTSSSAETSVNDNDEGQSIDDETLDQVINDLARVLSHDS